jgi:putative transposase
MLYISHTGCQWRYLPESFGPWTRVWSQSRRWSRNGTWTRALTALHAAAREADGRADATPSMVVIDTHLARGASNGGFSFHDRGGRTAARRAPSVVAVDVTGLPVGALVVPASTHENRGAEHRLLVVPPDPAQLEVVVPAECAGSGRGDPTVHQDQLKAAR